MLRTRHQVLSQDVSYRIRHSDRHQFRCMLNVGPYMAQHRVHPTSDPTSGAPDPNIGSHPEGWYVGPDVRPYADPMYNSLRRGRRQVLRAPTFQIMMSWSESEARDLSSSVPHSVPGLGRTHQLGSRTAKPSAPTSRTAKPTAPAISAAPRPNLVTH